MAEGRERSLALSAAPAETPADLVDKINKDVARALQAPDIKERLANLGAEPMPMTPAEFKNFVRTEIDESGLRAAGSEKAPC